MKALTIWQPWASLIMIGAKPYEFRGKSYVKYIGHPNPGDRIVIHAGARKMKVAEIADLLNRLDRPEGEDFTGLVREPAGRLLQRIWKQPRDGFQCLELGAGLGTAIIGKPCIAGMLLKSKTAIDSLPHDSDRGEFNWAWPLNEVEVFDSPIPARGMQGFWEWRQ